MAVAIAETVARNAVDELIALGVAITEVDVGIIVAINAGSKVGNDIDEDAYWTTEVGVGSNPVMEIINSTTTTQN